MFFSPVLLSGVQRYTCTVERYMAVHSGNSFRVQLQSSSIIAIQNQQQHLTHPPHKPYVCLSIKFTYRSVRYPVDSVGVVFHQAVDMNPFGIMKYALICWLLERETAREVSFRNIKTMAVCLAEELVNGARETSNL
eukprot:scaffold144578_cov46-Cyclotella_meneghiniana.AAC.3